MITLIEGKTANIVWNNASEKFQEGNNIITQHSRTGQTKELLHAIFTIKEPRQRWVTSRNPGINPAFAIVELIWIMMGRRDSAFVLPWNGQLARYIGNSTEYHGAYGYRLRTHLGFDQIDQAYQALDHNSDSRQIVMQIWDSKIDLPNPDGSPRNSDIPCNIVSLLKVRNGKLEWSQIMRSNDLFRGVPYNFIQFTTLQEIMAGWLGIEVGSYHHFSDSLHVYESDLASIYSTNNLVEEQNTDNISLQRDESELVIKEMAKLIEILASDNLTPAVLTNIVERANLPPSYLNMLLLVAGEAARRRRWNDLVEGLMWGCTNPMLIQAWFGWISRFKESMETQSPED